MRTLTKGRRNHDRWVARRAILEHERGRRTAETNPVYDWDERVAAVRAEILSGKHAFTPYDVSYVESGNHFTGVVQLRVVDGGAQ